MNELILLSLFASVAIAQDAPAETPDEAPKADEAEAPTDDAADEAEVPADTAEAPADAAEAPADAPPAPDAPGSTGTFDILYTGATGGVAGTSLLLDIPASARDAMAQAELELTAAHTQFGVMVRGREVIIASDNRPATLSSFVEAGKAECTGKTGGVYVRNKQQELFVDASTADGLAKALADSGRAMDVYTCTAGGAEVRYGVPTGTAATDDWKGFELRLGVRYTVGGGADAQTIQLIGVPYQEASRRLTVIKELREASPDALFVDSGSFVDGIAALGAGSSPHRATMFDVLKGLKPTALVPGRTELAPGAKQFIADKTTLPYVATNWKGEGTLALPDVIFADTDAGRVAFLGVVDPELSRWAKKVEGLEILPAVATVQAKVDELRASDDAPDVIIVLGAPEPALMGELKSKLRHVDLIFGDSAPRTDRLGSLQLELRNPWDTPTAAYTFPLDGVGLVKLSVDEGRLTSVAGEARRVTVDIAPDAELMKAVQDVRFKSYLGLDKTLLPANPDAPVEPISEAQWTKAVCEAVLDYSRADFAVLPPIPAGVQVPGPLSELMVLRRLEMLDVLEVHEADGGLVKGMVTEVAPHAGALCGVAPDGSMVSGRPIESARLYKVLTTDRAMSNSAIAGAVRGAEPGRLLDQPSSWTLMDDDGNPVKLADATMSQLKTMRDEAGADGNILVELNGRDAGTTRPGYAFRINSASVGIEGFQGAENPNYAAFPETLATSPSSSAISTNLDLGFGFSNKKFDWLLQQQAMYTRLVTADGPQEAADDLRTTAKFGFPGIAFKTGPLAWKPTVEGLLDSEITPTENAETGELNTRQAELSATVGLDAGVGIFTFHAGAFTLRDLADFNKPLEFGGRFKAGWALDLGYNLKWTTTSDTFVWADTPETDETDLRLRSIINTDIAIPLARWLSLKTYGQVFVVQGRLKDPIGEIGPTDQLGASYTLGTALDLSGAFVF